MRGIHLVRDIVDMVNILEAKICSSGPEPVICP